MLLIFEWASVSLQTDFKFSLTYLTNLFPSFEQLNLRSQSDLNYLRILDETGAVTLTWMDHR